MFAQKYERVKLLGEGAYGTAHLVQERTNASQPNLRVAKEIRTAHLTPKQQHAALAESEVLRRMSHPNIIAYIESFLDGPTLYIVMEYADGGDLASKIATRRDALQCPFLESEVMFIHLQITLALAHVHGHKILHRDLKPLNVFLTGQGIVKLGDFGIAKVLESTTAGAQTAIGTPLYISPEVCNNEPYGVKSDLWSLGVVTYELASLRAPFQATSLPALVMKVVNGQPEPLPSTYSSELSSLVFSFLAKEPRRRPALEDHLRSSFVRSHLSRLRSHSLQSGFGGCEGLVQDPIVQVQSPARVASDQTRLRPASGRRVPGASASADAASGRRAPAPPASADRKAVSASVEASVGCRRPQQQEDWLAEARKEYLLNREIANRAKQRARSESVDTHLHTGSTNEYHSQHLVRARSGSTPPLHEYGYKITTDEKENNPEDWVAQVRRKGKQERAEKDAEHLRQLEEARRQAHADRQVARQRLAAERASPWSDAVKVKVERPPPSPPKDAGEPFPGMWGNAKPQVTNASEDALLLGGGSHHSHSTADPPPTARCSPGEPSFARDALEFTRNPLQEMEQTMDPRDRRPTLSPPRQEAWTESQCAASYDVVMLQKVLAAAVADLSPPQQSFTDVEDPTLTKELLEEATRAVRHADSFSDTDGLSTQKRTPIQDSAGMTPTSVESTMFVLRADNLTPVDRSVVRADVPVSPGTVPSAERASLRGDNSTSPQRASTFASSLAYSATMFSSSGWSVTAPGAAVASVDSPQRSPVHPHGQNRDTSRERSLRDRARAAGHAGADAGSPLVTVGAMSRAHVGVERSEGLGSEHTASKALESAATGERPSVVDSGTPEAAGAAQLELQLGVASRDVDQQDAKRLEVANLAAATEPEEPEEEPAQTRGAKKSTRCCLVM